MTLTNSERLERRVLLLMTLVQFISIWDFMIIMPLGPDIAHALHIDTGHVGWISGSYSISAAIVGILSARYLDRFDRRSVLLFSLSGLMVSTSAMILADTMGQMIAVRMITGVFGGPMVGSSLAIIADVFPENRRGEALGKVFGSFSIAAVLGVPLGLEIAQYFGWWAPFIAISVMALVAITTIRIHLPSMRHHLDNRDPTKPYSLWGSLRHNPAAIPACILIGTSTFAAFMIIPNISAHIQQNMGYPRALLGVLYFAGGGAAFFSMRFAGKQSDRIGYAKTCLYATFGIWAAIFIEFYLQWKAFPIIAFFILFMITMSTRNVTSNALVSKIPRPHERAGFMSLMSAVQHLTAGMGAGFTTLLLTEAPDGHLFGMQEVALISMITFVITPWMMFRIERILRKRHVQPTPTLY